MLLIIIYKYSIIIKPNFKLKIMSNHQRVPEGKDPEIWEIARKRVGFIKHAIVYVIVNVFLWGLWFFAGNEFANSMGNYPWPIWTTLGWGIGLAFNFAGAYIFPGVNSTESEYQKLITKK